MQAEMFEQDRHDAGGKVKTKLPAGMYGDAIFRGDRDEYRPFLRRWTGQQEFPDRWVCFIGMNPSTASASVNDSTITREWGFTVREGYTGYVKCNVSDYRATNPNDLLHPGLVLESDMNRPCTLGAAFGAGLVIVCWGSVNKAVAPLASALLADLRSEQIPLHCFGKNADGSPKHPLYLAANTPLVPF